VSPPPPRNHSGRIGASATLRQATLSPYDVIVLAAVEAMFREPGRVALPGTEEIALAARLPMESTLACLGGALSRQRLVASADGRDEMLWALTPLGREVLAELIVRERRRGQRR
jgi:hypothetical protein